MAKSVDHRDIVRMRIIKANKSHSLSGMLILDDFPEVQRSRDKLFFVKENILVLLFLVWICKDSMTARVN